MTDFDEINIDDITYTVSYCQESGEIVFLRDKDEKIPCRFLNNLSGLPGQCIIKNELFEKIAYEVTPGRRGASAGTGFFSKTTMEKRLGRKISYQDLYISPDGIIPTANFAWMWEFYQKGEVSKEVILKDLYRMESKLNPEAGLFLDVVLEIIWYKNIK